MASIKPSILVFSLALGLFVIDAQATAASVLESLPSLLFEATSGKAGLNFEYKRGPDGWRVAYCPDNTCDLIRAPADIEKEVLGDFTLLYLYYVSDYIYLKPFYEGKAKSIIEATMTRRLHGCATDRTIATAACVLRAMAIEHKITLWSAVYDEGEENEKAKAIDETLDVRAIEKTKNWQFSQWR